MLNRSDTGQSCFETLLNYWMPVAKHDTFETEAVRGSVLKIVFALLAYKRSAFETIGCKRQPNANTWSGRTFWTQALYEIVR